MENQHRQITGYRELTSGEIAKMNKIKAIGQELEGLVNAMVQLNADADQRWVAIGRTHLQEGLMALTRAIAKPTSF